MRRYTKAEVARARAGARAAGRQILLAAVGVCTVVVMWVWVLPRLFQ